MTFRWTGQTHSIFRVRLHLTVGFAAAVLIVAAPSWAQDSSGVSVDFSVLDGDGTYSPLPPAPGVTGKLLVPPRKAPVSELHVTPKTRVTGSRVVPKKKKKAAAVVVPKPEPKPAPKPVAEAPPKKIVKTEAEKPAPAPKVAEAPKPGEPSAAKVPEPTQVKAGQNVKIVFEGTASKLAEADRSKLLSVAGSIKDEPDLRLQLFAYAGGEGLSASKARRVSLSRALSVRSFLIENGIRSTRIDVRALGSKTTETPINRVDVNVTKR